MDYEKEIPFGAFDSELMHQESSIPEGFTATIEGNKIILAKTESEDEKKLKESLMQYLWDMYHKDFWPPKPSIETCEKWLAWLEKQGESPSEIRYWTEEEIEPIISDYLRGAEHYGGMIGRLRCLKPKSLERQGESLNMDIDIESMTEAYKQRLIKQCNGVRNSPLVNMCITSFRHGIENTLDAMKLKGLKKQKIIDVQSLRIGLLRDIAMSLVIFLDENTLGMDMSSMECEDIESAVINSDWLKIYAYMKKKLEKQGEPSIKWNKNTEGNKPQINHSVLMKTTHGIAEGEWQGEYWHQYRWAGIVRDSDVLSWVELSDLEKQGEQKPAYNSCESAMDFKIEAGKWYICIKDYYYSDIDELMFTKGKAYKAYVDWGFISNNGTKKTPINMFPYKEYFRPATEEEIPHEQKSAWSEEDEEILQGIWDEISAKKYDAKEYEWDTYDKYLSWLESLKNRYTWKPTEEQIKALADALSLAKNCGEGSAFDLRTLYEQLKKL